MITKEIFNYSLAKFVLFLNILPLLNSTILTVMVVGELKSTGSEVFFWENELNICLHSY
jgi:hypothetical protein